MKKRVFVCIAAAGIFISCFQDSTTVIEEVEILTLQQNEWKTTSLANEIFENQKDISHYEFNSGELSKLISTDGVSRVWFDLGLNASNHLTCAITGVNVEDIVLGEVASAIVYRSDFQIDFLKFYNVEEESIDEKLISPHILENKDVIQYLTEANKSFNAFESAFMHDGLKVERFGLEAVVLQRILQTHDMESLALFLGLNKTQKMTTVLIAKDTMGQLIMDSGGDIFTNGSAWDFTEPCPTMCDANYWGCTEYSESLWWMCQVTHHTSGD